MLKRLLAGLLCLLLLPLGVSAEEAAADPVMEKKTFPHLYVYDKKDQPAEEEMNLYFADGGDIPYVALSEYIPLLAKVACEAKYSRLSHLQRHSSFTRTPLGDV